MNNDKDMEQEKQVRYYTCRNCGFSPTNRADWCDKGCGRDYNEMLELTGLPEYLSLKTQEAREDMIQVFLWLYGLHGEFPQRQEGDGAYYWRTEMRKKLEAIGVILSPKEKGEQE